MNNRKSQTDKSHKFDFAYINPGTNKVTEAIEQLNNGFRVLLVFENELTRGDSFQLTQTFPLHLFNLPKFIKSRRLWKKLFLLSPHLVQAQKVIYSHSKRIKPVAGIIDFFFKNEFNEKSKIVNTMLPKNFSSLKNKHLKGVIFQEYKINVSRFFIELLKYFELNGGKIRVKESLIPDEVSNLIQCKTEYKRSFRIHVETPLNFAWVYKFKNNIFRFVENGNNLQVDTINATKNILSKNQTLSEISEVMDINPNETEEIKLSFSLSTKAMENILKTVRRPLPGSFKNTTLHDNYELCLEQFDIAKQSGITYPQFKILFYRYGNGIEEIIDEAYEKMAETRDPQKIWNEAEEWFQKKYEWKT